MKFKTLLLLLLLTGLAGASLAAVIPTAAQADQYPCGAEDFAGQPCAINGTSFAATNIAPTSYGSGTESRWYAFWAPAGTTVTLSIRDNSSVFPCTVVSCTEAFAILDLEPEIANPIALSIGDGQSPPGPNYAPIPPSTASYTTETAGVWDVLIGAGRYDNAGPQTISYTLTATAINGYFQWPAPGGAMSPAPIQVPAPTSVPPSPPKPKPPANPCLHPDKAFPRSHITHIGRTEIYDYQASVEYVVCDQFGYGGRVGMPWGQMACGIISSTTGWVGNKWHIPNLSRLGTATDGMCTATELTSNASHLEKGASILCSWAADLLGAKRPSPGLIAGIGCAVAPIIGTALGSWIETNHDHGVALGVTRKGLCIKYSPGHVFSPWLSINCASNDRRFN